MWNYCLLCIVYSVLGFILSDAHFCFSYEKVNYCKIRNGIIKAATSSDRKHFLVYIYVKVLFLIFI